MQDLLKQQKVIRIDMESLTDTLTRQQKNIADNIVKFFTTQTSERFLC